jgi:predicted Fe-S protein YdhL (DUF1289 family)
MTGSDDQHELRRPVSPCVGLCKTDPLYTHCLSCLRTVQEVALWSTFSAARQHEVVDACVQRREEQGGERVARP